MYLLCQDLSHHTIIFDLVTLALNFESHTLNVAIWLPFDELCCLLTTLVLLALIQLFVACQSFQFIHFALQVMTKLHTLDLSGNTFHHITSDALEMTHSWRHNVPKHINLSNCDIITIQPDTFTYPVGIRSLSLAGNTHLHTENLTAIFNSTNLQELKTLDLSHMGLSDITDILVSLRGLSVTELILTNNSITEMPTALKDYLRSLEILHCDRNQLTRVTESIAEIASLRVLDLSYNEISEIHSSFERYLTKLEVLKLSFNKLRNSVVNVENCLLLHTLDLEQNLISNFTTPSVLNNLKRLNLAGNIITDLQPLSGLTSLEYFDISRNQLKKLNPFLFTNSENVQVANFSGNGIIKTNHQTFTPNSPQVIDLSNNRLKKLWNMGWLGTKVIDLHGNDLVAMDDQAFYALYSLHHLDLSYNNLSYLQPDAFTYLTNVSEISLSHNKLHSSDEVYSALRPLINLRVVDLSYNNLNMVRHGSFSNSLALHSIKFSHNLFVNLNPFVFVELPFLKEVDLSFNPYSCDCKMIPFRDWLRKAKIKLANKFINDSYVCKGPEVRAGEKLWKYEVGKFECDQTLLIIIIFSSVGGVAIFVAAITAFVCHFFCKYRKSRSYGVKRITSYRPVKEHSVMNGDVKRSKEGDAGRIANGRMPRRSRTSSDIEVEMLLKQHQTKPKVLANRGKEGQNNTRSNHKGGNMHNKHRNDAGKSNDRRKVRPSQSMSALNMEGVRDPREVRFNRHQRLPRVHSRSEADLRQYRSRQDRNMSTHRNPRTSRDMADIIRTSARQPMFKAPGDVIYGSTMPYVRRPRGPRPRQAYPIRHGRGPSESYHRAYDSSVESFGSRHELEPNPRIHPGYYTVGGKRSFGHTESSAVWI